MEPSDPVSTGSCNEPDEPDRPERVVPAPDASRGLAELQGFCEILGAAFWVYDLDAARIDFVSPAYEELWGRPTSELCEDGDAWLRAVHEEDLELVKESLRQLQDGHYDVTYRILRPNGDLRWVRTRAVSFLTDESGGRRVAGMAEDVTGANQAEEDERQRAAQLEQISRLNTAGELAAGIAHELNQPLSAIVNYIGGCLRRLDGADDELREALENAAGQAERAGEILRRLRRYSRRGDHQPTVCSLNEIVSGAVLLLVPRTRELGITVQLELCTGADLVLADSAQVVQVLAHLVRNGYEAMDGLPADQRLLVIRTRGEGAGFMLVEVEDRGPGLSRVDEERAFEPFHTTREEAIGLGLTISRSIVEDHGGRLWYTQKDSGCAFCFSLPRASSKIPT